MLSFSHFIFVLLIALYLFLLEFYYSLCPFLLLFVIFVHFFIPFISNQPTFITYNITNKSAGRHRWQTIQQPHTQKTTNTVRKGDWRSKAFYIFPNFREQKHQYHRNTLIVTLVMLSHKFIFFQIIFSKLFFQFFSFHICRFS